MLFPDFKDTEPFDPDFPHDAQAEAARKAVVEAFEKRLDQMLAANGEELQSVAAGALVGLVGSLMCMCPDEEHRRLAKGLEQMIPWAVNQSRSIMQKPLLETDH